MVKTYFSMLLCLVLFQATEAQWSADSYENSAIADKTFDEILPKLATGNDGYSYVSWISLEDSNYNVRLQKLDSLGNKIWDEAGLLISDFPSFQWDDYSDWDMTMDDEGNIILVFPDNRTGFTNIYAYQISPDGEFNWGGNGIELSENEASDRNPKVTITDSGNIVFAWVSQPETGYDIIAGQKVSPIGELLWEDKLIVENPDFDLAWPYLYPAENDEFILFWHTEHIIWLCNRNLYCQKIDETGNSTWNSNLEIYTTSSSPIVIPALEISEGLNDNLFICWYENVGLDPLYNSMIQQIDFDGNLLFSAGGISVSAKQDYTQMIPQMTIIPQNEELVVFWSEQVFGGASQGIYGQKLSFSGEKIWGAFGKEFVPLSNIMIEPIDVITSGPDILVFYKDNDFSDFIEYKVKAMRIDNQGEYVWYNENVILSEVQSDKVHFSTSEFNNNQWIIVWDDYRNDNADIYGQNIQLSGVLGPISYEENIAVRPDSVYLPPSFGPEPVYIINEGYSPVEILNIPLYNYLTGWEWYIDNDLVFPVTLDPGEYLELLVQIVLYTGGSDKLGWACDWIIVETETNSYQIELCLDDYYLPVNETKNTPDIIKCYPVPANKFVTFETINKKNIDLEIAITHSSGKLVKSLALRNTNSLVWDLKDENGMKVSPGIYYYRLISDEIYEAGKIIIIE